MALTVNRGLKMSAKQIVVWPDRPLQRRCAPVIKFDDKLRQLVIDMQATMAAHDGKDNMPDAAGLAAPQIGVMKRVFVYKLDKGVSTMINPVILEKEGVDSQAEGCLSFPGIYITVKRAKKILVEFQDVDGKTNQMRTEGFTARCIQHEIDHLDGITFIHALSSLQRDVMTRKMKKARKKVERAQKKLVEQYGAQERSRA
jgi:peptide deformylase